MRSAPAGTGHRPRTVVTALVAGCVLILPACSTTPEQDAQPSPSPAASSTSSADPSDTATPAPDQESASPERTVGGRFLLGRWPLDGRRDDGKAPPRPVAVVKVDNTAAAFPQLGLGKADLVVEELVEGGRTRLAAFYYRRVPRVVGPVRSLRGTDLPLVRSVDPSVVIASGGAPPTVRRFERAGVRVRSERARGFFRAGGRTAPYNLMVDLPALLTSVPARRSVPEAYLPWGDARVTGPRARRVTATFSGARSTVWEYRGGRYRPLNGFQAPGGRFLPSTVLALRVPLGDAGYLDPAGSPVPETRLVGRGEAVLFHGGRAKRATWVKRSQRSDLRLRTRRGDRLTVPAGKTWIELVPTRGGSVSWSARR